MRVRREAHEALAETIEVAARLFAENGYSETTTRELSSAMGVTNGTLYHHFPSKESLLRRIADQALEEITAEVSTVTARVDDPLTRLERLVYAHVSVITSSADLHTTMLTELRSLRGENYDAIVAARDKYSAIVRDVVSAAQRAGAIRNDLDASTMTLLLLNLMNWTIFWYGPDGDLAPENLADSMLTVFLDGARLRG